LGCFFFSFLFFFKCVLLLGGIVNAQVSASITTIPYLPSNIVATNYASLQLVFQFDKSNYGNCRWRVSHTSVDFLIEIFTEPALRCEDRMPHNDYHLRCTESSGIVNSTLIVVLPLQTDISVVVECAENVISPFDALSSININVVGE